MEQRVRIYRNLTKGVWSVMDSKTRLVINHLDELTLIDCAPIVSEAGRQRVLKEKAKNVHAFLAGNLAQQCEDLNGFEEISYNPYDKPYFFWVSSREQFLGSSKVVFLTGGKVMALIE